MVQGLDDAHGAARVLKAPQNRIQPLYRIRDSLLFGRESRLAPLFQLRLAALVRNLRKHPKSTDAYMVSVGQLQQFLEFLSIQRQVFSLHSPRISHGRGKIFVVAMEYQL